MSRVTDIKAVAERLSAEAQPAWLSAPRQSAVERVAENDLPDTHYEDYQHFDVRKIYADVDFNAEPADEEFDELTVKAVRTVIAMNGEPFDRRCSLRNTSDEARYNTIADNRNAVTALNTALTRGGVAVSVAEGEHAGVIVLDLRYAGAAHSTVFDRVLIDCGADSTAEFVVVHRTRGEVVVNTVREMFVGRGAKVRVTDITLGGGTLIESRYSQCDADAELRQLFCTVSEGLSRSDYVTTLAGEGVESSTDGVFITGAGVCDTQMLVRHMAPHGTSSELVKGIAWGEAVGSFAGRVYVAPDSQKTDAQLTNRNIVVGRKARIFTKPTLEIYADDVKCGHGAAVGQLDDEAVYYMRQRGISEAEARRLQLLGFASDVVTRFGGASAHYLETVTDDALSKIKE